MPDLAESFEGIKIESSRSEVLIFLRQKRRGRVLVRAEFIERLKNQDVVQDWEIHCILNNV